MPGVRLIPGVYAKASVELGKVQLHFLECLRGCECDFLSLSVPVSFKVGQKKKKQNETKPNETKTQTDLAELKPQIATETRELLVCVCFPVRCCQEIQPPHVAAKYVNSSNVDGQRNHQQGPHKIVG